MKQYLNILELNNLSVGYKNKKQTVSLVNNIFVKLCKGELIALIGRNGSGKSSLSRTILGLNQKISGKILFKGKEIEDYSVNDLSKIISFVSTSKIYVPNAKVKDIIALGRGVYVNWYGKLKKNDKLIIEKAISLVGIEKIKDKDFSHISDGERQRVMIARAIAQDTDIIVLDEPTSFLDLPNKFLVLSILEKLSKEEKKTIIFSSHDIENVLNIADKIWLINSNQLIVSEPKIFIDKHINNKFLKGSDLFFDINDYKIKNLDFNG